MSDKSVTFFSKQRTNPLNVSEILRQISDRLQENRVTLRRNGEEVTLSLPDEVTLEIKVDRKQKKGGVKHGLEIELEWFEGEAPRETLSVE